MLLSVREIANGKWRGILASLGLNETQLSGKHTACPVCGGKDRFRFDDKNGRGTFYCSQCGAGDGVELVKRIRSCEFREAAEEIERVAGFVRKESHKPMPSDAQKLDALKRVWAESKPVINGDGVHAYLIGRGLEVPSSLRIHHELPYRDGEAYLGKFVAMIAKVQSQDGHGATLHRTYLQNGKKAPLPKAKKLMPGLPIAGAAIRLYGHGDVLGVAEGIETAISAKMKFGIPVWSCVSAGGVAGFVWPESVKRLVVFADNDESYTGQQAAYTLAKRCAAAGVECQVMIPEKVGTDWADVCK